MIERIRGVSVGKLVVAGIGVVAMVALATGAVAANNSSFQTSHGNQPVFAGDPTGSAGASATVNSTASIAICDPTLDQKEDTAEQSARAANPSASMAPEASEPPHCNILDKDGDNDGDKPTSAPTSAPTAESTASATASCDPTLDQQEDAAEKAAKESAEVPEEAAGQSEEPKVSMAPEASEPPQCKPSDPDSVGDSHGVKDPDKSGDTHLGPNGSVGPRHAGKRGGPIPAAN